ncbi:pteroicidin-alpha-like [Cololabis saira]|uniref:pteroicidin-alpha-like n=1 Tax=Cololabis saira TaxID=129043 RepID=UPI002AD2213B|nr:pteroicidin-alpha-like [Cololabis saira]
MKCTVVFLVLSMVVLMAEPGEGFIGAVLSAVPHIFHGIKSLFHGKDKLAEKLDQQQLEQLDRELQEQLDRELQEQLDQQQQEQLDQQQLMDKRLFEDVIAQRRFE